MLRKEQLRIGTESFAYDRLCIRRLRVKYSAPPGAMLATGSNQAARDVESGSPPSLVAAAASLPDRWRERFCVAVASDRDCAFRPAACRGPSVDWSFEAVGWKIGDRPFVPSARCRANAALTLGIPQGTNVFRGVQGCNQMASFGFLGPRCRCTKHRQRSDTDWEQLFH
jgi:hypothetical protein